MDPSGVEVSRIELVMRRYRRQGWLWVAAGVVVPLLAGWGAYRGFRLWRLGRSADGLPLFFVGAAVFGIRLALFAHTGFRSAF